MAVSLRDCSGIKYIFGRENGNGGRMRYYRDSVNVPILLLLQ